MVRTRIAPSPTGENLHIGNVYTALLNYAYAKKHHGAFIVRIEDTDRTRFVEGTQERILSMLRWFGIIYDEAPDKGGPHGPYVQSQRLSLYRTYARELIEKGKAYYCFCTSERLAQLREAQKQKGQIPRYDKHCLSLQDAAERVEKGDVYVIRLNVEKGKKITFHDVIRGEITISSDEIDDQVLLKSDGYPTYHLGVVIDDHLMEVSHVIRAEEWISSTPKHILLYEAFGWKLPVFSHVSILRNPDRSKLSKRKNPVWASWFKDEGYLPEAITNFLGLMGGAQPENKEIFTLDEFIAEFHLEKLKAVGPVFDIQKLTWLNGEYIRRMSHAELVKRLCAFDPQLELMPETLLVALARLAQTRIETLSQFRQLIRHVSHFEKADGVERLHAEAVEAALGGIDRWEAESILTAFRHVMQNQNIRMQTLYVMLTGEPKGLPLPETCQLLGKEEVLRRLSMYL
jgi:glutamyl-tRNA synthetase